LRSFKFWLKVTRLDQCLIAALATWVIALLSNGHDWWSVNKIAASMTMFIGVMGASVFHYGAARKMYARKYWDLIDGSRPWILITVGSPLIITAVSIAFCYLPRICFWIAIVDTVSISLYAIILSKYWITKNTVIAFVCTTPVLMGWLAGNHIHPALPYFFVMVFFSYLGREIFKDINDIEANKGLRVTLPIWLGSIQKALWVAYTSILLSCICLLLLFDAYKEATIFAEVFYLIALLVFLIIPLAAKIKGVRILPRIVTIANSAILISALALRLAM